LVRRAATEALSNLVPDQGLIDYLAVGDKIRLWLLLSEDAESDFETARAACGCLASLAYHPETAAAMRRFGATERLAVLCLPDKCPHGEISHRAAVALTALAETEWVGDAEAQKLSSVSVFFSCVVA